MGSILGEREVVRGHAVRLGIGIGICCTSISPVAGHIRVYGATEISISHNSYTLMSSSAALDELRRVQAGIVTALADVNVMLDQWPGGGLDVQGIRQVMGRKERRRGEIFVVGGDRTIASMASEETAPAAVTAMLQ